MWKWKTSLVMNTENTVQSLLSFFHFLLRNGSVIKSTLFCLINRCITYFLKLLPVTSEAQVSICQRLFGFRSQDIIV